MNNNMELLKMAVQVTETILNDKGKLRADTEQKAELFFKDSTASSYMKILMYVKKDLAELLNT